MMGYRRHTGRLQRGSARPWPRDWAEVVAIALSKNLSNGNRISAMMESLGSLPDVPSLQHSFHRTGIAGRVLGEYDGR